MLLLPLVTRMVDIIRISNYDDYEAYNDTGGLPITNFTGGGRPQQDSVVNSWKKQKCRKQTSVPIPNSSSLPGTEVSSFSDRLLIVFSSRTGFNEWSPAPSWPATGSIPEPLVAALAFPLF